MIRISTSGKDILSWLPLDSIEKSALEQAMHVAELPFIHQHVALMPDAHSGYGVPIGCVFATYNVLVPHAVGYDIGCGVRVIKTNLTVEEIKLRVDEIEPLVRSAIPMGVGGKRENAINATVDCDMGPVSELHAAEAKHQLGTLGAGNHFIELQRDDEDTVWVMIHSGSRHLGHSICEFYDGKARYENTRWHSSVPAEWDLAFLPSNSKMGRDYEVDMNYALAYAECNRRVMMMEVVSVLKKLFGSCDVTEEIDCHHNYASLEKHMGSNVWVHRKGATLAREGVLGIIPGDMASPSYIVRGNGNVPSFASCSHGAGRGMSRKAAKQLLSVEDEQRWLDAQGVHFTVTENNLDETSGAYKDIGLVMRRQFDLVEMVTELYPVLPMKG